MNANDWPPRGSAQRELEYDRENCRRTNRAVISYGCRTVAGTKLSSGRSVPKYEICRTRDDGFPMFSDRLDGQRRRLSSVADSFVRGIDDSRPIGQHRSKRSETVRTIRAGRRASPVSIDRMQPTMRIFLWVHVFPYDRRTVGFLSRPRVFVVHVEPKRGSWLRPWNRITRAGR